MGHVNNGEIGEKAGWDEGTLLLTFPEVCNSSKPENENCITILCNADLSLLMDSTSLGSGYRGGRGRTRIPKEHMEARQ